MIHYIKGRITETTDSGVVIERNGIGYELTVPALSAVYMAPADQEVTVYTAMIVREDDVSLYGFDDRESLKLFRLLMTVSGIGAKAAVAVLSALSRRCRRLSSLTIRILWPGPRVWARRRLRGSFWS